MRESLRYTMAMIMNAPPGIPLAVSGINGPMLVPHGVLQGRVCVTVRLAKSIGSACLPGEILRSVRSRAPGPTLIRLLDNQTDQPSAIRLFIQAVHEREDQVVLESPPVPSESWHRLLDYLVVTVPRTTGSVIDQAQAVRAMLAHGPSRGSIQVTVRTPDDYERSRLIARVIPEAALCLTVPDTRLRVRCLEAAAAAGWQRVTIQDALYLAHDA